MKIGVIIQGPLVTHGDGPNNSSTGFNSLPTIVANIKTLKKFGISYVISTWRPQNPDELRILKIIKSMGYKTTINVMPQLKDPYNAYKQHLSILYGLPSLVNDSCTYLIKIRTDMLLPDAFWKWLITSTNNELKNKLLVSELYKNYPFYLGDFIIGGEPKVLYNYVRSILSFHNKTYFPLSAFDDGIKFLVSEKFINFAVNFPSWIVMYFLLIFKYPNIKMSWNNFLSEKIAVLPYSFWKLIIWRGNKMIEVISPSGFLYYPKRQYAYKGRAHLIILLTNSYFRLINKLQKDANSRLYKYTNFLFTISSIGTVWINMLLSLGENDVVLGRYACIGKEVLNLKHKKIHIKSINQQKMRLDLFMEYMRGGNLPKSEALRKHIKRADVFPLIQDQENLPWLRSGAKVSFLLLDSFSELTDKKFTNVKEKWSFACHYSDIEHTSEFDSSYTCDGLLDSKQFLDVYTDFFAWFENCYPETAVYFIHTPTALDDRSLYKKRDRALQEAIRKVQVKFPFVHAISVSDEDVEHDGADIFPYHFSKKTYYSLLNNWNTICSH